MSKIIELLKEYDFYSPIDTVTRLSGGNINTTYLLTSSEGEKYILQRINTSVFSHPEAVMENIVAVTKKLKAHKMQNLLDKMQVLNIKFTRRQKSFLSANGEYYRVYDYMPGAVTYYHVDDLTVINKAGRAFGEFVAALNKGEPLNLNVTIKSFHDTRLRFNALAQAYKNAEEGKRVRAEEIYKGLAFSCGFVDEVSEKQAALPLRIVHNDTKCDNVAFDKRTGDAIGILDLDTVMYGLVMNDFGDGARSICSMSREDEKDLSSVGFDLDRFSAFCEGYLPPIKSLLTEEEKTLLCSGAELIALELSARFLTDYLMGDVYFKIDYPEHNLVRARCQLALATDVHKKTEDIKNIISNTLG